MPIVSIVSPFTLIHKIPSGSTPHSDHPRILSGEPFSLPYRYNVPLQLKRNPLESESIKSAVPNHPSHILLPSSEPELSPSNFLTSRPSLSDTSAVSPFFSLKQTSSNCTPCRLATCPQRDMPIPESNLYIRFTVQNDLSIYSYWLSRLSLKPASASGTPASTARYKSPALPGIIFLYVTDISVCKS